MDEDTSVSIDERIRGWHCSRAFVSMTAKREPVDAEQNLAMSSILSAVADFLFVVMW